ncbi:MAG: hypothetical protein A2687_05385 [Candidatus Levybacteria bacterium RIFCSPHIGHO2_01_FULL_38_26]|nr:MAG: hypothetical protein A2687_05385 [Candidatus Levybacteria bacterium RIFCSPHIGHO2_01_FULL_38_26]
MSKQTLVLIILLFFFTAGLMALAFIKYSYDTKTASLAPKSVAPTISPNLPNTSLLFGKLQTVLTTTPASTDPGISTPSAIQQNISNSYSIPILINTGSNFVTVVQLEIAFDPNILSDIHIEPSGFFDRPIIILDQIDYNQGRISYALGAEPPESENDLYRTSANPDSRVGKKGQATLATLSFNLNASVSAELQSSVTFLPKTFVMAEGVQASALKSTNSAELIFPD